MEPIRGFQSVLIPLWHFYYYITRLSNTNLDPVNSNLRLIIEVMINMLQIFYRQSDPATNNLSAIRKLEFKSSVIG